MEHDQHDWTDFRENFLPLFTLWDEQIRMVFRRLGGDPWAPYYRFATNEEMIGTGHPYIGLPVSPGMWNNGREFVSQLRRYRQGLEQPPYEQIISSDPVYTWMREESKMDLNCLIIAHANCGHAQVFKHNRVANEPGKPAAQDVIKQFAEWADALARLENDPEFGVERVEYTADAAIVLQAYCREKSSNRIPNDVLRRKLEGELRRLQQELGRIPGGYDAEIIQRRIDAVTKILGCDPINPTDDIVSFIMDPKQNPGLSEKEREVCEIVFGVAKYWDHGIHFIHEGSSEFWNYRLLNDPQTALPHNWKVNLASRFWNMFERNPMNRYNLAYWLGRFLFQRVEREHCPYGDEIEVPTLVFRKVPNPFKEETQKRRVRAKARKGKVLEREGEANEKPNPLFHPDRSRWMLDEEGDLLVPTGEFRLIKVRAQDLSFIFDVIDNYDDTMFFHDFLTHEAYQEIHDIQIKWVAERMEAFTRQLKRRGWNKNLWADPVPATLDDKLEKIMQWRQLHGQMSQAHQDEGTPRFPMNEMELEWMMQIVMLVRAYHSDRRVFRDRHIARLSLSGTPRIRVVDGGVESKNGRMLVLEHMYDPTTGQLRESWARKAMELLPRIYKPDGSPGEILLLTKKDEIDEETGETKNPKDFWYHVSKEGKVTENDGRKGR